MSCWSGLGSPGSKAQDTDQLEQESAEEEYVVNGISLPKSDGVLEQAVQPFKAGLPNPHRRLFDAAGKEIEGSSGGN